MERSWGLLISEFDVTNGCKYEWLIERHCRIDVEKKIYKEIVFSQTLCSKTVRKMVLHNVLQP